MGSFSFGSGNAGKLLRLPLYVLGRLVTLLIPRTRDEWVFGSAAGVADGALALWERAAHDAVPAVWLTGDADEQSAARSHGIPHLSKSSLRGFWRTARARVIVVTHGFGDVNRYATGGGHLVQLWHGIPLKRIGLDSPVTTRSPLRVGAAPIGALLTAAYRSTQRRIRLIPAASHLIRGRLESAFGLGDAAVPVTGEPRVDVLSRGTAAERRIAARAQIAAAVGAVADETRIVLYAPTWRDGAPDPAIPDAEDWAAMLRLLDAQDALLLIRSHPLGAGDYAPPRRTDRVRRLGSDLVPDVTPLLPGMDVLITDYSSLAFDSALVPLPVVWFAPDEAEYAATRGFYGRYRDIAGPDVAETWAAVTAQLRDVLDDEDLRAARLTRAARLSASVHAFTDGGNTERVYRAILRGLAKGAA